MDTCDLLCLDLDAGETVRRGSLDLEGAVRSAGTLKVFSDPTRTARRARALSWVSRRGWRSRASSGLIAGLDVKALSVIVWAASSFVEGESTVACPAVQPVGVPQCGATCR